MILEIFKTYLLTLVVFLGIDGVWLSLMSKNFYGKHLAELMAAKPNLVPALIFYLVNIVGMVYLVIFPAIKDGSWSRLIISAAIYGLCTYATYDLTNMATLKNWPMIVTVVDMIWGTLLTTAVSSIVFFIRK